VPPLPAAIVEDHPFGIPPIEIRSIWVFEINDLAQILSVVESKGLCLEISYSGYWSGSTLTEPGERLFGISLYEDLGIDRRRRPIRIVRKREQ
jgi:hypothetical protein